MFARPAAFRGVAARKGKGLNLPPLETIDWNGKAQNGRRENSHQRQRQQQTVFCFACEKPDTRSYIEFNRFTSRSRLRSKRISRPTRRRAERARGNNRAKSFPRWGRTVAQQRAASPADFPAPRDARFSRRLRSTLRAPLRSRPRALMCPPPRCFWTASKTIPSCFINRFGSILLFFVSYFFFFFLSAILLPHETTEVPV